MSSLQTLTRPLAARVASLPPAAMPPAMMTAPEAALVEAEKALDAGRTHYTDRPGILPLRQRVAALLTAEGLPITADAITISCGVIEGRFVALKQLAPAAGRVASPQADLSGLCTLLGLTLTDDPTQADVVYTVGAAGLTAALATNTPWIVCEHQPGEAYHLPTDQAARVVVIGEFSQLVGWRVGFMAGSKAAGKLRAYKQSMTICTPSTSQWAATGLER
jgi:DNA-binding transcriptional MocR family regulator